MFAAPVDRKLATILSADVVGFSRLMHDDEEATLSLLKECQQLLKQTIGKNHGRIVGAAGDSVMAEFSSPVEAVRCAVSCQEALQQINADLPSQRHLLIRIGI